MKEFIKIQYALYKQGKSNISLEKIHKLAEKYMTEEERNELFQE
jgi:hypothetical protein